MDIREIEIAARRSAEPMERSRPTLTYARLAGVTSIGMLSLLLNPLFIAPVVGVAALLFQRHDGSIVGRD
jgi:hypothetical protein